MSDLARTARDQMAVRAGGEQAGNSRAPPAPSTFEKELQLLRRIDDRSGDYIAILMPNQPPICAPAPKKRLSVQSALVTKSPNGPPRTSPNRALRRSRLHVDGVILRRRAHVDDVGLPETFRLTGACRVRHDGECRGEAAHSVCGRAWLSAETQ